MNATHDNKQLEKLELAYAKKQISTAEYEMWCKVYGVDIDSSIPTDTKDMVCPKCSSLNYNADGTVQGNQRYICNDCGYRFTYIFSSEHRQQVLEKRMSSLKYEIDKIESYLKSKKGK